VPVDELIDILKKRAETIRKETTELKIKELQKKLKIHGLSLSGSQDHMARLQSKSSCMNFFPRTFVLKKQKTI
jgi:cell division septum initiation protein DivIVA